MKPILYIVIPCYNEKQVLPLTVPLFLSKLDELISCGKIACGSRVLFVNDGSSDSTWKIISEMSKSNEQIVGISLSRNSGHQNALLAGLEEASDKCDVTISIDCDGQDDLDAMNKMIDEYLAGSEIVYGVRASRKSDSLFKRTSAHAFYKFMKFLGVETVYNHADYRLVSSRVLKEFSSFKEVNLYLRGMFPLVGFKSTAVYYDRNERLAGKSKYPIRRMISLALDGITSLSTKPIRIITALGFIVALLSCVGVLWSVIIALLGRSVAGWASLVSVLCLLGGVQLISIGIIGEYVGKIYLEAKARPRYIIEKRTQNDEK